MGGGGGSDVKNAVWMRALIMAGMILGFAVVSYVGLGVVVADMKHHTWEDEEYHYKEAKSEWQEAVDAGEIQSDDKDADLYKAKEEAHHHEIDAHLSYLTYRVAGLAILFVGIIFTAFLVISGIMNSSRPDEHHDDHHGHDDHEHMAPLRRSSSRLDVCCSFSDSQTSLTACMAS